MTVSNKVIIPKMKQEAETQLEELRKEIDYDTRDYAIDYIVSNYGENYFFIDDEYQRKYIWEDNHKSRFMESILLGLPIPFMFFADTDDMRCEIIDGAQRTQTLVGFVQNDFHLSGLKKLTSLNGFTYKDLPDYFQRRLQKTTIRVIVLSEGTTVEIRQEIFHRINTAGVSANPIEIRRGAYAGPFMNFLKECTKNPVFIRICPISPSLKKRHEDLELILRFFAFLNNYTNFKHRVHEFLDDYCDEQENTFDKANFQCEFERMVNFVDKFFPFGFRKMKNAKSTPRVRFEAIAVGVGLALRERPDLEPASMAWLDSDVFKVHTTTHASNSRPRVRGRIEYVRDCLLSEN